MGLIQDADAVEIRKRLEEVVNPVTIIHFTQELNLELGAETLQLMKELAATFRQALASGLQLPTRQREGGAVRSG